MRKMDLIFIGLVVLLLGYYSIKSDRLSPSNNQLKKPVKNHSEGAPKSIFTSVSKQIKKNTQLVQEHTRIDKTETISNQQLKAQKSPTEYYEETLRYYRLINADIEQTIQSYIKKEQEMLQTIQSKKRDVENYENMMMEVKPSKEDLLFVVKTKQEMSIVSIEGIVSTVDLLLKFIKDTNKNLQQASFYYKQSERKWDIKDKMEFTRHIQDVVHRTEEAHHYFEELTKKVDQCKKLIDSFIKLSESSLNVAAELHGVHNLKNKETNDKSKEISKEEKQWENNRVSVEAKGLQENIDSKLKEIDWLFRKLESHIKVTVQTFEKASRSFPVKRGFSSAIKKLLNFLSQQQKNN